MATKRAPKTRIRLTAAISGLGEAGELLPENVERTDWLNGLIATGYAQEVDAEGEPVEQADEPPPAE